MTTMKRSVRWAIGVSALLAAALASRSARAESIWIEAEEAGRDPFRGNTTSPMLIKDSAAASGGSYIVVEDSLDSKNSPPALGQACFRFGATGGTYKVWGRVMAASVEDDSFWVRMDSGSWIKWNEIKLGSSWHWDFVHNDVSTAAITFPLTADDHSLCVAYRESGTKLDLLVITNEAFDPNKALTAPPAASGDVRLFEGKTARFLTWQTVVGATSYTVQRRAWIFDGDQEAWVTRASSLTGHTYSDTTVDTNGYCYRVIAKGPSGTGVATPDFAACGFIFNSLNKTTEPESNTLTAPMKLLGIGVGAPAGLESLNAPPASGSTRWDFVLGSAYTVRMWAIIDAPNKDQDSFWVRIDQGAWIKWNGFRPMDPDGCAWDIVHDSNNAETPLKLNLAQGGHTIEFAYREGGASMDRILLTDDLSTTGVPGCFD
jgi:hypothetical protein